MAKASAKQQKEILEKCFTQYGNKDDSDMVNLLYRCQKNVCTVKTT